MHKRAIVLVLVLVIGGVFAALPAGASPQSPTTPRRAPGAHSLRAPYGAVVAKAAAPTAPVWMPAAPIPTPVHETGGGAGYGSYFYAIGGFTDFGSSVTSANQLYNKTTNTWIARAPFPSPSSSGGWADAAFCVNPADHTIHVVNGQDGFGVWGAHFVFNPSTNTWTGDAAPNLSNGVFWYGQDQGCAFIGGKMYLFGGYGCITATTCPGEILTATWVFDPSTHVWTDTGKSMIAGRMWMGYTNTTSTVYVAGGTNDLSTHQSLGSTESFTPTGGWVAGPALPGGHSLLAPGEGVLGKYVGIFGGGEGNTTTGYTLSNVSYACTLPGCTRFTATTVNLPAAKWLMAWGSGSSAVFEAGGDDGTTIFDSAAHVP